VTGDPEALPAGTGRLKTGHADTGGARAGRAETGRAETGGGRTGRAETGGARTGHAETGRAAVFDLDGTIVDSEPRSLQALRRLFGAHHVPHDQALLRRFVGRRGPEVFAELDHLFPGHQPAQLSAEVAAYFHEPGQPPLQVLPGAAELAARIHQLGDPLALVTSAGRRHAVPTLAGLGLLGLFEVIVAGDDVTVGKPDPEGYRRACDELGVAPSRCVAFEDSPAGLAAARAAGLYCVAVTTTHPRSELAEADQIVTDLTKITWPVLA
jgi:mannitol-1-/sugar-/sorbitol-6-phosphatase